MRERVNTRFSGRTLRRPTARKKSEEVIGVPETPHLPDEFNRNAPLFDEVETEAKRRKHLKKMMMFLAATGAVSIGLFAAVPALTEPTENPEAEATYAAVTPEVTPPDATAAPTVSPEPTAALTAAPTPEPTPAPTPEPTQKPEVEGVELLYAEWVDGTHESAVFNLYARIPLKNIKEKRLLATELEVFAWLNGMRTVDDWDGINTLEVSAVEFGQGTTFGSDDNGDVIVTYSGTLYWADHPTPAISDLVTIAVCGVHQETWELTEPSNSLTVGIGGKAFLEDTTNEPSTTQTP